MTNLIILMKIKTKVIAWDISGELSHCKDGFRANKANLISLRKIRMIVAILRVALKIWKSCCRQIWQRWYYHWLRRTNLSGFHIAKLSSGVQLGRYTGLFKSSSCESLVFFNMKQFSMFLIWQTSPDYRTSGTWWGYKVYPSLCHRNSVRIVFLMWISVRDIWNKTNI